MTGRGVRACVADAGLDAEELEEPKLMFTTPRRLATPRRTASTEDPGPTTSTEGPGATACSARPAPTGLRALDGGSFVDRLFCGTEIDVASVDPQDVPASDCE